MKTLEVQLEQFSGPLDALLQLIDEQELPITEVSLSTVTEQFLIYVDQLEEKQADELADFLLVAARLLLLKSKQLLPQFLPEEEDGPSLEDQLRLYKVFVVASKQFQQIWDNRQRSFFHIEPPRKRAAFELPENVTQEKLAKTFAAVVDRLAPPKPLPNTHIDQTVSLKQIVSHIRSVLKQKKRFSFDEVLGDDASKTTKIVGFLALLELAKQHHVSLDQAGQFGDIIINKQEANV